MNYIVIVGKDYRDCKNKLNSISPEPDTQYPLCTKFKHVRGINFSKIILTENFINNPEYNKILQFANKIEAKIISPVITKPKEEEVKKVEIVEEIPIEEQDQSKPELKPGETVEEKIDEIVPETETIDEVVVENNDVEEIIVKDDEPIINEDIPDRPVGDAPKGWHLRKEYIDGEGNIFQKGKYVGNLND